MAEFPSDYLPPALDDLLTAADVAALRPPSALWGYNVQVTDEALGRIAQVVTERDVEIAVLRQQLAELRGASGPAQRAAARVPAAARNPASVILPRVAAVKPAAVPAAEEDPAVTAAVSQAEPEAAPAEAEWSEPEAAPAEAEWAEVAPAGAEPEAAPPGAEAEWAEAEAAPAEAEWAEVAPAGVEPEAAPPEPEAAPAYAEAAPAEADAEPEDAEPEPEAAQPEAAQPEAAG